MNGKTVMCAVTVLAMAGAAAEGTVSGVKWLPVLNGEGVKTGTRIYMTLGKANLADTEWKTVPQGDEKNYNFFTVTVDMPEGK